MFSNLRLPPLSRTSATDIVVFGENSLDVVGRVPAGSGALEKISLQSFAFLPGGQAATAAAGCARLGVRTRYVGAFGVDTWGLLVRDRLVREGVEVVGIDRPDASSRVAIVLVDDESGRRTVYEYRHPGLAIDTDALPVETWIGGKVLLVDATDLPASIAAVRLARHAGVRTMVDIDRWTPGVAPLLANVDVIIVAESFLSGYGAERNVVEGLRDMAARFQPLAAIVTLGEEGSLAVAGGQEIRHPAQKVDVVDTTGAGDAFRAGFAAAWLRLATPSLDEVIAVANAAASLNCRSVGAMTSLPVWEEVQGLIERA